MFTISKITYQTSDQRFFSWIAGDEIPCSCAQNTVFIYVTRRAKRDELGVIYRNLVLWLIG